MRVSLFAVVTVVALLAWLVSSALGFRLTASILAAVASGLAGMTFYFGVRGRRRVTAR